MSVGIWLFGRGLIGFIGSFVFEGIGGWELFEDFLAAASIKKGDISMIVYSGAERMQSMR